MALRMLVSEESSSKLVLTTNPEYIKDRDKSYASSRKSGIGCYLLFAIVLACILLYLFTTTGPRPWYFWAVTVVFSVALAFFLFIQSSFIKTNRNFPLDSTITIDLDTQRAVRIEKLNSGEIKQSELNIKDVVRILIDCQAVGHSCRLMLESQASEPFEVNSAYDFDIEAMKEIGKKIGGLLNKPVSVRWFEGSKIDSEEEI